MPPDVKKALKDEEVLNDYYARPDYQQNDYIGWIIGAKREETRRKRIKQMMNELRNGGVYMGMIHNSSKKRLCRRSA